MFAFDKVLLKNFTTTATTRLLLHNTCQSLPAVCYT